MVVAGVTAGHIAHCLNAPSHSPKCVLRDAETDYGRCGIHFSTDVACLAWGLRRCFGLTEGEVVCLALQNSAAFPQCLLAVAAVGGIVCPLNPRWSAQEACSAAQQVSPALLVVDEGCLSWLPRLLAACPSLRAWLLAEDGPAAAPAPLPSPCPAVPALHLPAVEQEGRWEAQRRLAAAATSRGRADTAAAAPCECSGKGPQGALEEEGPLPCVWPLLQLRSNSCGMAVICFTSGSTGRPKGAAIPHLALVLQSMAKLLCVGYCSQDVFLHAAPFCHVGGLSSLHAMLLAGGLSLLLRRYQPEALPPLILRHAVTALIAVPAMLSDLAAAAAGPLPSVRRLLVGGGAMSSAQTSQCLALFPRACVMTAYGMTEAASSITFHTIRPSSDGAQPLLAPLPLPAEASAPAPSPQLPLPPGSCVGCPPPHVDIRIAPLADGSGPGLHREAGSISVSPSVGSLPGGAPAPPALGEVLTRGPHLMAGYWQRPEDTAAALLPGGWLATGDVGWVDGIGRLWLCGRRKEMLKSGGENVFCAEVEGALAQHPAVAAAAVAGLPHERWGEQVAALLQLREGWRWREGPGGEKGEGPGAQGGDDTRGVRQDADGREAGGKPVTAADIQHFCTQLGLSRYKVPRVISGLQPGEVLPVTPTGKIHRVQVREILVDYVSKKKTSLSKL